PSKAVFGSIPRRIRRRAGYKKVNADWRPEHGSTLYTSSASHPLLLSTAATSIAAARIVLALLERKIDGASGDTSEVRQARSDSRTVNRPESRRTSNGEALRYKTANLDR